MKQFLQKRKRKGFTLVELLIVIIIIGILAGSMMLVMGAGKDKAEATKIVSNLRSLKSAAVMCYADENYWPSTVDSFEPYMDADISSDSYSLAGAGAQGAFSLGYKVSDMDTGVKEKLAAMADESNIYGGDATSADADPYGDSGTYDTYAWVIVNK